eukprot:1876817-Amphidinium_carterae.1
MQRTAASAGVSTQEPEVEPDPSISSISSLTTSQLSGPPPSRVVVGRDLHLPERCPLQLLLCGELNVRYHGSVYVVWQLRDCRLGDPRYISGVHWGREPWLGLLRLTRSGRYTAGLHRLRRVHHISTDNEDGGPL